MTEFMITFKDPGLTYGEREYKYRQTANDPAEAWTKFCHDYKTGYKSLPIFVKIETIDSYQRSLR